MQKSNIVRTIKEVSARFSIQEPHPLHTVQINSLKRHIAELELLLEAQDAVVNALSNQVDAIQDAVIELHKRGHGRTKVSKQK
jgi:hypothetical protein